MFAAVWSCIRSVKDVKPLAGYRSSPVNSSSSMSWVSSSLGRSGSYCKRTASPIRRSRTPCSMVIKQIFIPSSHEAEFSVPRNPNGVRREKVKTMIETRQILPEDIFQQHGCILVFLARKLNEPPNNLSRNMNDRKFRVRQGRGILRMQR